MIVFLGKSLQTCEIRPIFAVRKTKNLKQVTTTIIITNKKYTTMIAIAFITLAISASVALRIGAMIMDNHNHAM
jgi:hypothetical protein